MRKNQNQKTKGFSLVETLVAIALFSLGIAATTAVFSKTIKSKAYTLEMGRSAFTVSRSLQEMTQYLRRARQSDAGAYAIVSANKNDLVVYSDYDKDGITERLHFYFSNNKIYMGVRKPSTTFPVTYASGDGTTIMLAERIVNTASDSLFTYYTKDYPQNTNPLSVPADPSQIRLVKMFVKINIDPNRAPDNIQQETFVEFRNLNDYDQVN